MKIIRASEIGTYLYCNRAWWYQRQGYRSQNQAELADGTGYHHRHGSKVIYSNIIRVSAYVLLLAAITIFIIYLLGLTI